MLLHPRCGMCSHDCTSGCWFLLDQKLISVPAVSSLLLFPHLLLVPCSWLRPWVPGLIPFGIDCDLWFCCAGTNLISRFRLILAFGGACSLPPASRVSHDAFLLFDHFSGVSPARAWSHGVT